jgi:hypothetical protein
MGQAKNDWTDPIVEEIHRIREEMASEAGGDIFELIRRLQESSKKRLSNSSTDEAVDLGK